MKSLHGNTAMKNNIGLLLTKRALVNPQREAYVDSNSGLRLTFEELNKRCNRLANSLLDSGISKGDRVALALMNSAEFIEAYFAVAKIGGVVVPLNWRLVSDELEFILKDSGAETLIFGEEFVKENTVMISLINANSPMTWDGTMLGALKEYARSNQAVITTPFILSGAMAPVTPIGVLAQTLAEAMSGMAFAQMINPGAPVVFGSFASSISMQSGAPTFGTPEPAIVLFTAAKLARRLGVPFRSGGSLNGAKIPDAQAAIESLNTLWPSVLGGVNFVLHAAGWLEGGLVSDIRKFIIDADQCSAMSVLADGPDVTENGQAMDAIRQVGPGQHFLGCDHTQRNFETAFWTSKVSDNSTFEQWSSEGKVDQMQRAGEIAKKLLESYEPPEIDPSIDEALRSFIEKRKEELPNTEA